MKKETVLLITHSNDFFTIDRVQAAVSARGYRAFRLNTDEFPQKIQLSLHLENNHSKLTLIPQDHSPALETSDIHAVWLRKIWVPFIDEEIDPLIRKGCISESMETMGIFLKALDCTVWMDHISQVKQAENKYLQLRQAQAAGIKTPKTLISNNPNEVRAFFNQLHGAMIAKLLTPLTVSMKGDTPTVRTHQVQREHLDELDSLQYSPMVFQERIEKKRELRMIYVAGEVFTGAVNPHMTRGGETDWRASTPGSLTWETFHTPEHLRARIKTFMKRMGLHFGALDIIEQPDGEFIFLEVNPTGEWGMLERDLGLPISTAIADFLTQGI